MDGTEFLDTGQMSMTDIYTRLRCRHCRHEFDRDKQWCETWKGSRIICPNCGQHGKLTMAPIEERVSG